MVFTLYTLQPVVQRVVQPAVKCNTVSRTRLVRYGHRSFIASGPVIWNTLQVTVRELTQSITVSHSRLKAELFTDCVTKGRFRGGAWVVGVA